MSKSSSQRPAEIDWLNEMRENTYYGETWGLSPVKKVVKKNLGFVRASGDF